MKAINNIFYYYLNLSYLVYMDHASESIYHHGVTMLTYGVPVGILRGYLAGSNCDWPFLPVSKPFRDGTDYAKPRL